VKYSEELRVPKSLFGADRHSQLLRLKDNELFPNLLDVDNWHCPVTVCDREFNRMQELNRHILTHHFPYPSCQDTWRGERSAVSIKRWVDNHNDEGPVPVQKKFKNARPAGNRKEKSM
jgi:hypothetical protein